MHYVILGNDDLLSITSIVSLKDGQIRIGLRIDNKVDSFRLLEIGEGGPPLAGWSRQNDFRFIEAVLLDQTEGIEGVRIGIVASSASDVDFMQGSFSIKKDDSKQWYLTLRPSEEAKRKRLEEAENDRIVAASIGASIGLDSLGM